MPGQLRQPSISPPLTYCARRQRHIDASACINSARVGRCQFVIGANISLKPAKSSGEQAARWLRLAERQAIQPGKVIY